MAFPTRQWEDIEKAVDLIIPPEGKKKIYQIYIDEENNLVVVYNE